MGQITSPGLILYKVKVLIVLTIGAIEYPIIKGGHILVAYETKHISIIYAIKNVLDNTAEN
jgi:hypothetical protein